MSETVPTFGILVGGGPAPGINSVIEAATIRGRLFGAEVLGIADGFKWLMKGDLTHTQPLTRQRVQAGLATLIVDKADRSMHVAAGLRMKSNITGACLREIGNDAVDRIDHQMHIDRRLDAEVFQGLANHGSNGQVGHEVIVHDIEMHDVGTGLDHCIDIVTKAGEISRKN